MPQEIWIVSLLPDEHEMSGGHELGDVRTAGRGARKGIGAHAPPAGVITAPVVDPQILVRKGLLVSHDDRACARTVGIHAGQDRCDIRGSGRTRWTSVESLRSSPKTVATWKPVAGRA